MKASELRIGNFVTWCNETYEVRGIDQTTIGLSNGWWDLNSMQPIPLTEDWFLRFGFELRERDVPALDTIQYFEKDGHEFIQDINGKWFLGGYSWNTYRFIYVHTLQNLYFALTGNELELK